MNKEKASLIMFGIIVGTVVLTIFGCQPPEVTARDSIAAFSGVLVAAQAKHTPECLAARGELPVCSAITRAAYAENAAVDALETYCQFPPHTAQSDPGQICKPVTTAREGLMAALRALNTIAPEIEKAAK